MLAAITKIKHVLSRSKGQFSLFNPYLLAQFLSTQPSLKQLMLQIVLAFKWSLFTAWNNMLVVVRFQIEKGKLPRENFTIKNYLQLLHYCLIENGSPYYFFKFRLYKNYAIRHEQITDDQLPLFHDVMNIHLGFRQYKIWQRRLSDKYEFSAFLEKIGISVVVSETLIDCSDITAALTQILCKKSYFCKPNQANQSQDAFLLRYNETDRFPYSIYLIQGTPLTTRVEVEAYLVKVIRQHKNLLLQVPISDHPEIKKLSQSDECATMRVITVKEGQPYEPYALYAQLEVPLKEKKDEEGIVQQYYDLYPIALDKLGFIKPKSSSKLSSLHKTSRKTNLLEMSESLKQLLKQGIELCLSAHQHIELYSIGFDVVFDADGARILEGNYNWSVEIL